MDTHGALARGIDEGNARTAVEATYRKLYRHIIDGVYRPGTKLRVEHLKSAYQVSGSTIREALTRLISDQLVLVEGQKGFRVSPMSMEDLEDLTYARIILECAALKDSISQADEEWEAHLVAAFHRLSRSEERLRNNPDIFDEWEQRNREFHEALVASTHSEWLKRLRLILFQQSERYRRLSSRDASSRVDVHDEHKAIFEAAIARDANRAEELLRSHIQRAVKVLRENTSFKSLAVSDAAAQTPGEAAVDLGGSRRRKG